MHQNSQPISALYPNRHLSMNIFKGDFLLCRLKGANGLQCIGYCTLNREKLIKRALKQSRLLHRLPMQSCACNGCALHSTSRGAHPYCPIDLNLISEMHTAQQQTAAITRLFCIRRCHALLCRTAILLNCSHISVSTSDGLYEGLI